MGETPSRVRISPPPQFLTAFQNFGVAWLLLFDRTSGPAARNLMIASALGMWSLFCIFEALVAIRLPWMTGFYLIGIASTYFGYRMLHWFALERPPAWEFRLGLRK